MIVHIMTGNSDDKLTQQEWAEFVAGVDEAVGLAVEVGAAEMHGRWFAAPDVPWQSAAWCVGITDDDEALVLRGRLAGLAHLFRQDSIAWHRVDIEVMIGPDAAQAEEL